MLYRILTFVLSTLFTIQLLFAQNFHSIDSIIEKQIQQQKVSGAVAMIIYKNNVVLDKAYGYADKANRVPMTTESIFRVASQTKAIVSVAFLQLVESGKIGLNDPIEKYIPAFQNQQVAIVEKDSIKLVNRNRSITIRDLLSHQSGISSSDEYPKLKKLFAQYQLDKPLNVAFNSLQEEVEQIAKMPLAHQPGDRFSYGLSTNVLGRLIEIISGKSLDVYLKENIFKPLQMKDSYFYLPKEKQNRLVKVYRNIKSDSISEITPDMYPINYPNAENRNYFSAIGGLVSTTHDYAKFLTCLLNDGLYAKNKKLLSKQTLDQFTSNQLGDKTFIFGGMKSLNNFGLGVGLTTKQGTKLNNASEGSFFWGGAFNTAYMVDKMRQLITLFYFQRVPFDLPPVLSGLEKQTIAEIDKIK
jgi:CubicO group peptidase (beta-lactamase class C family)